MTNYDHLARLSTYRNVRLLMFLRTGKRELDLEITICIRYVYNVKDD